MTFGKPHPPRIKCAAGCAGSCLGAPGEERKAGYKEFNPVEMRIFWLRYLDFGENL
jgi:hypothetical protein